MPVCHLQGAPRVAYAIRDLAASEADALGRLMVDAYAALPGFPSPDTQPGYYAMLRNIGDLAKQSGTRVLVAVSPEHTVLAGITYYANLAHYGTAGAVSAERNASGIRLLAVDSRFRNQGLGRALTMACIALARANGHSAVILHTTKTMPIAWALYQQLGFLPAPELDFTQQGLPVFGFRLELS